MNNLTEKEENKKELKIKRTNRTRNVNIMSFQRTKRQKWFHTQPHIQFNRQLQNCTMESDEFETTVPARARAE